MAGAIKGGKVKGLKALKASLKKGGNAGYLQRVPADSPLTVRFLTEPTEWIEFFEHYDDVRKFYPCTDDCPGCLEGETPSKRYLVNALDVAETKVIPLVLPKTLASSIMKKYDRFNTLLDRDYELSREGTGFDTEYDAIPEPVTPIKLSRFEPLDLMEVLEGQLGSDDDEDEDVKPVKRAAKKTTGTKRPVKPAPDDEDDEDDDEESGLDEFAKKPRTKTLVKKSLPAKKAVPAKKALPAKKPTKKLVRK